MRVHTYAYGPVYARAGDLCAFIHVYMTCLGSKRSWTASTIIAAHSRKSGRGSASLFTQMALHITDDRTQGWQESDAAPTFLLGTERLSAQRTVSAAATMT